MTTIECTKEDFHKIVEFMDDKPWIYHKYDDKYYISLEYTDDVKEFTKDLRVEYFHEQNKPEDFEKLAMCSKFCYKIEDDNLWDIEKYILMILDSQGLSSRQQLAFVEYMKKAIEDSHYTAAGFPMAMQHYASMMKQGFIK